MSYYDDSLIKNFLIKEQIIWDKMERNLDPLPHIQMTISEFNRDLLNRSAAGDVGTLVSRLAKPYKMMYKYCGNIEDKFWEGSVNTNLTKQEIDQRYTELDKLSNDLFNLTSQDIFWEYVVEGMVELS